jgi:integrase
MAEGEAGFHRDFETTHTWQKSGFKNTSGKSDGLARSHPPAQPPKQRCPECTSQKVWRDGLRYTRQGEVQRYLCRSCGYRFSEHKVKLNVTSKFGETSHPRKNVGNSRIRSFDLPRKEELNSFDLFRGENVSSHGSSSTVTGVAKRLKALPCYNSKRQVCATLKGAKNLAATAKSQKRDAGATTKPTNAEVKGKIVEFAWWLKKEGYRESTIKQRIEVLKILVKQGANLYDPESVKEVIAQQSWCENTKHNFVHAYNLFIKMLGLTWEPPRYTVVKRLPFIPLESELDQLISAANKKLAAFLQTLKETAMRSGEAWHLKWIDIDFKNNTIRLNEPEKHSNPRMFKVSGKLITMLNKLPRKNEYVFGGGNLKSLRTTFFYLRKRLSYKLENPRFNEITFHTFRHWKATMEYAKTKDILYIKQLLGHKSIENTLRYTQLVNFETDEYISKVAKTVKEAMQLVEAGFEYVCEFNGVKIFRKRK